MYLLYICHIYIYSSLAGGLAGRSLRNVTLCVDCTRRMLKREAKCELQVRQREVKCEFGMSVGEPFAEILHVECATVR